MRGQATINCPIVLWERVEPAQTRFDLSRASYSSSAHCIVYGGFAGAGPARFISRIFCLPQMRALPFNLLIQSARGRQNPHFLPSSFFSFLCCLSWPRDSAGSHSSRDQHGQPMLLRLTRSFKLVQKKPSRRFRASWASPGPRPQ